MLNIVPAGDVCPPLAPVPKMEWVKAATVCLKEPCVDGGGRHGIKGANKLTEGMKAC